MNAQWIVERGRRLIGQVKVVFVFGDVDRAAINDHVFEHQKINAAALLYRRNDNRNFKRDAERRHARDLRIAKLDQRVDVFIASSVFGLLILGLFDLDDGALNIVTANFIRIGAGLRRRTGAG